MSIYSVITGSGSYIPKKVVANEAFLNSEFFNSVGEVIPKSNTDIVTKFQQITDIEERRYIEEDHKTSDLAFFAAKQAIESAGIDPETLDHIIVAHNFGELDKTNRKIDAMPSIAARVKNKLRIENPYTVAYDIIFGCPGWIQALIQANYYIKSGDAKRILVIGAESISRITDPHDIDSMIFSDGAGAVILEAKESDKPVGILNHLTRTDTLNHAHLLRMGTSYNPDYKDDTLFIKMEGRKLYEYALNTVPSTVKDCVDRSGIPINNISKILIHQANAKMDDAIISRLFRLYGIRQVPEGIMPMTINKLGNNSVATVPVLFDLISRKQLNGHHFHQNDYIVFASVGAGMHVNAIVYKM